MATGSAPDSDSAASLDSRSTTSRVREAAGRLLEDKCIGNNRSHHNAAAVTRPAPSTRCAANLASGWRGSRVAFVDFRGSARDIQALSWEARSGIRGVVVRPADLRRVLAAFRRSVVIFRGGVALVEEMRCGLQPNSMMRGDAGKVNQPAATSSLKSDKRTRSSAL